MKRSLLLLGFAAALVSAPGRPASADELVFPPAPLDRGGPIEVVYRLDEPASGRGILAIEWTDAHGRLVERREQAVTLDEATELAIELDLCRAAATANRLRARLTLETAEARESDAEAVFFVPPRRQGWPDYQVIMWQPQRPDQFAVLREIGVSAGKAYATPDKQQYDQMIDSLLDVDLPWYVENIATDFYSAYHRWTPDKPKNWRFLEVRKIHEEDPGDPRAFIRDPSLSDPAALADVKRRLRTAVETYAPFRPLFYNLADEPGIAQTGSFWDFDLSEHSLVGMRAWLREEYGDLDALNRQWGTRFGAWDEVVPMSTTEAVHRSDENFSAWADFKAWMDVAFARAIREGVEAVHQADPDALAAIEGAQIPGWGGYDYTRLADAVDVMEIYDYGENVDIVRSLNPDLVILATSGGSGPREAHVVWRDLLRGSRGVIFWDDEYEVVGLDGRLGERGRQAAGWIAEIRSGIGALLIGSERHLDPIAMLYSPASHRTQWLLDVRKSGQDWTQRTVDSEYEDNAIRASSRRFRWTLNHMGLQHRIVSPGQVAGGLLLRDGIRLLILPHAVSLSPEAADEIRAFVARGGILIADGEPGVFDEHSRRLAQPLLADLFPGPPGEAAAAGMPGRAIRLETQGLGERDLREILEPVLADAGIASQYRLMDADGPADGVETYVFRNGDVTLLAFQRNPAVVPASGDTAEAAEPVSLALPRPAFVYDLLQRRSLGRIERLEFPLDGVEPTLLALAEAPLGPPAVAAPAHLAPGETGRIEVRRPGVAGPALQVYRVEILDPTGAPVRHYAANLLLRGRSATHLLPLALNDPAGSWQIRVTDPLSGQVAVSPLEVAPR